MRFAPARSRASLATAGIASNSSRCAAWPIPVLVDQETIYAPRHGNDRLVVGLKGSLNEYEPDLLRQRSLSARCEKARRGELVVAAPVGFMKAGDRYEKDPDRRVHEAIKMVFDQVLGGARQALCWRHGTISIPVKQTNGDTARRRTHHSAIGRLKHWDMVVRAH
ncbi:DNA invertase Pin-like site-specific DNA recombinase [Bradyrhizobium sp. GM5.1]